MDAGISLVGGDFGTTLQAAASNGIKKMIQILVDNGAHLETKGRLCGYAHME